MKRFCFFMLMSIMLLSACTKDELDPTAVPPPSKVGIKEAKVARLYALKTNNSASQQAVAVKSKLWAAESTIKIKFLNGNEDAKNKVKQYAKEWEDLINLKFEYVPSTESADVKIGFNYGDEDDLPFISWLTVGTDCQSIPQDEASINFVDFYDIETGEVIEDEEFIQSEVLRAFGCILGLDFEHRSPASKIELLPPTTTTNKNRLRGYFGINLPIETIQERFLGLYTTDQSSYTEYDAESIMVLPLPSTVLKDPKYTISGNSKLSETDKKFISALYPKDLKVEWVADAWSQSPTCMDKYDNLYFFKEREKVWKDFNGSDGGTFSQVVGSRVTLMKLNTTSGVITTMFDVPNEYYQIQEVAVDGQGNVYIINNIDLSQGMDLLMFDRHGNLLRNLSRWTGAMYASLYARIYCSIRVLDSDDLLYVAEVAETNCSATLQLQHYKYNPTTQTSTLMLSFSANDYWMMRGKQIAKNNISYVGLSYLSGQNSEFSLMKFNAITYEYSFFNISPRPDDIASKLGVMKMGGITGAARDIDDFNLLNSFWVEKSPGCGEIMQFFYDYNTSTNDARNLGVLPKNILKSDNTPINGIFYQGAYSSSVRNGKIFYTVGSLSSIGTGCILKITNHR